MSSDAVMAKAFADPEFRAMGGFKRLGADMKPDLAVDAAGRWLADCCNPEKREKLSPTELAYIRRRARAEGVHVLAAFEMRDAGYADPLPVEPEDERSAAAGLHPAHQAARTDAATHGVVGGVQCLT